MTGRNRCSYCWQRGHNKRNCPRKRKELERQLEKYPDNEWAKEQLQKPQVTCGWCGGKGHNQRTCPARKRDMKVGIEINAIYRKLMMKLFQKIGVVPGALLETQQWEWVKGTNQRKEVKRLRLITGYLWDRAIFPAGQWEKFIQFQECGCDTASGYFSREIGLTPISIAGCGPDNVYSRNTSLNKIVSYPKIDIFSLLPKGWLSGKPESKELLKELARSVKDYGADHWKEKNEEMNEFFRSNCE